MIKTPALALSILLASIASLTACGGGGGGGSTAIPVEPDPVVPDPDPAPDPDPIIPTPEPDELVGGSGTYNEQYWKALAEKLSQNRFASSSELYAVGPNVDQCDPGVLNVDIEEEVLSLINETRNLVGLNSVSYSAAFDDETAAAALFQYANQSISTSPSDSGNCYSQLAFDGSQTSNLVLTNQRFSSVAQVLNWLNATTQQQSVIRARRAILNPDLPAISYGQVEGASALKISGFTETAGGTNEDIDFIAYPYGRFPYMLLHGSSTHPIWSIEMLPGRDFDFSEASIIVSALITDVLVDIEISDLYLDELDFASWSVPDVTGLSSSEAEVIVSIYNVIAADGNVYEISYGVSIDSSLQSLEGSLEATDSAVVGGGIELSGEIDSLNDVDSYPMTLSGFVSIEIDSSSHQDSAFVVAVYDADSNLYGYGTESFTLQNLPYYEADYVLKVSLCSPDDICYDAPSAYQIRLNSN